jgi:hypothetical protein
MQPLSGAGRGWLMSRGRWVKGGQGRQECRPQAWRPAPQEQRAPAMRKTKGESRPPPRLAAWHARLRAPREHPVWHARLRAPREAPVWQARWADTLVRPYMAQHRVEQRAVGEGGQGRLESRPQARKPAPQEGLPHNSSLATELRGTFWNGPLSGAGRGYRRGSGTPRFGCGRGRRKWRCTAPGRPSRGGSRS